jgi:glycosyltransferase involved in cell wall biosynthesis
LVVLESLACGRPAVVTDVGGLSEAVGRFGADLVVPPGDPEALGSLLVAVASGDRAVPDPQACRAEAERRSWASVAAQHDELYRSVAEVRR